MSLYDKGTGKWLGNKGIVVYAARPSHSCRTLANALTARRWYENSGRGPRVGKKLLVNWGSTLQPPWQGNLHAEFTWLNKHENVGTAINKLAFFRALEKGGFKDAIAFTDDLRTAQAWHDEGRTVVERSVLDGHSGRGIRIVRPTDTLREAPLYTRWYGKTHEYRVHVFKGLSVDVVEKRRRISAPIENLSSDIRTADNGWVYAHSLSVDAAGRRLIEESSVNSVQALGLDFGAVDVLAKLAEGPDGNRRLRGMKVCEVNTAPGLENTATIEAYRNAINSFYQQEVRG